MKKGFTLIELLAVIVVISIIGLITTPVVINNIEKSRVASYRSSVTNLMDASKEYVTKNYENNDFPTGGIDITKTELNLKNNEFKNGVIAKENGVITAVDVYDGKYCARGEKNNLIVNKVESIEECKTSSGMDSTPPEIKRITVTEVTNTKIKVVVVSSDIQSGIKEYEYCVGDICKTSTTNNYTFKGLKANTNYEIKVKVRNNNYRKDTQYKDEITESTKSIKVKTKAIEKPTIKVSSTAYGTGKKVIIIYPSSGEEQINSYEINGKKEITQNSREEVNVTENGIIKATIEMKATGEKVENEMTISGIDVTSPNLKIHYFKDDTSWGKTKTIEIVASDLGSGLAKKPYSYDGGKTWMSSNKRTYNKEDEVVNIVVRDKVGNKSSQTFKLDKVDVTGPDKPNITNPTNGNWVNYDFALTVSSNDKRSGLGDWYYSYDNNNWTKYNNSTGKNPFTTTNFTKERNQEVYIRVCDKLGNCSKSSSTYIRIDKTKPTCVSSGGSTSWTNSSRTLVGTCSDSRSGCKGNASWYIYWEGNWSNLSPGTVSDNAGNSTVCPANQTVRIDKTAPNVSYSLGGGTYQNGKTIYVYGSDNASYGNMLIHVYKEGVFQYQIYNSNTSNAVTIGTGNWTIYTQIHDNAGNKHNAQPDNGYGWYYQNYAIQEYSQSAACGWNSCLSGSPSVCQGGYVNTTGYGQCAACGADYSRCKAYTNQYKTYNNISSSQGCRGKCTTNGYSYADYDRGSKQCMCVKSVCTRYYYAYCYSCPVTVWSDCASLTPNTCQGGYNYCWHT